MRMDHMINQGNMIDQLDLFFDVKIKNWSRLEGYGLYCKLANETWSMYGKKKASLSISKRSVPTVCAKSPVIFVKAPWLFWGVNIKS